MTTIAQKAKDAALNYKEIAIEAGKTVGAGFGGFLVAHILTKVANKNNNPYINGGVMTVGAGAAGYLAWKKAPLWQILLAAGFGVYGMIRTGDNVLSSMLKGTSGVGFLPEGVKNTIRDFWPTIAVTGSMGNLPGRGFNPADDPALTKYGSGVGGLFDFLKKPGQSIANLINPPKQQQPAQTVTATGAGASPGMSPIVNAANAAANAAYTGVNPVMQKMANSSPEMQFYCRAMNGMGYVVPDRAIANLM